MEKKIMFSFLIKKEKEENAAGERSRKRKGKEGEKEVAVSSVLQKACFVTVAQVVPASLLALHQSTHNLLKNPWYSAFCMLINE